MKILYSLSICLLLLVVTPFITYGQEADENAKLISLKLNDDAWQPQATRGEYLLEKNQDAEMISLGMFRLDDGAVSQLNFRIVRFKGVGEYKVGEKYNLIGIFQKMKGTEEGPKFKMQEESGMVEITAFDAKNLTISGKFSFNLKDEKSDQVMRITDGKFKNVQLIDVTPAETNN